MTIWLLVLGRKSFIRSNRANASKTNHAEEPRGGESLTDGGSRLRGRLRDDRLRRDRFRFSDRFDRFQHSSAPCMAKLPCALPARLPAHLRNPPHACDIRPPMRAFLRVDLNVSMFFFCFVFRSEGRDVFRFGILNQGRVSFG